MKTIKGGSIMKGLLAISIVTTCVIGGIIIKKLKDIHEEIIYFEDAKSIHYSKKEYSKLFRSGNGY